MIPPFFFGNDNEMHSWIIFLVVMVLCGMVAANSKCKTRHIHDFTLCRDTEKSWYRTLTDPKITFCPLKSKTNHRFADRNPASILVDISPLCNAENDEDKNQTRPD